MRHKTRWLLTGLGLVLALVLLGVSQRQALATEIAVRQCISMLKDHYPNVAPLKNAPPYDLYMERVRLRCRADTLSRGVSDGELGEAAAQESIGLYSELITVHGADPDRAQRANMYRYLGRHVDALADYNYLLTIDPGNFWMLENRADLYAEAGDREAALADYREVLERAQFHTDTSPAYIARLEGTIATLAAE